MKILVKLGGALLDAEASRHRLAAGIAALTRCGHAVVVVHGGGRQMTRFLSDRGIESRFVNGLRVTTPEVLDAVLKVLAGSVNQELVAALIAAGAPAVGLSGVDAMLAEAEPISPELGLVGRTLECDPRLLHLLTQNEYLPVVACIAGDRTGQIYNVNADQMAVACAIGFGADKLWFLTDVEGVRGADNEILPALTADECEQLIAGGIATGGMHAKLNAAIEALRQGVGEVVIGAGADPGIFSKLVAGEPTGTRLFAAAKGAIG